MDDFDRFKIRQRALRRARLDCRQPRALWDFEHWDDGPTEEHHPGRRKFSHDEVMTIPKPMHGELTRRGEEEHPPLGSDPENRLERQGRLHLGLSDIHAGLSDAHRELGETMLAAVRKGERDIGAVQIPKGLLGWIQRITHDVTRFLDVLPGTPNGE